MNTEQNNIFAMFTHDDVSMGGLDDDIVDDDWVSHVSLDDVVEREVKCSDDDAGARAFLPGCLERDPDQPWCPPFFKR